MGLIRSSKCMYCGEKVKNTQYGQCESCGEYWHLQCAKGNADFRQAHESGLIKDKDYYRFNCPSCGYVMEKKESHIL
jgi:predicted RNA-binding Zn-ribbon protein involved in translation (DUF1610 family)